jgi:hypothetical protein
MPKIGFVFVGALYCRIDKTRTVLAQSFEECARVPAVFGTRALIAWIERSVSPIRSEVRNIPDRHPNRSNWENASHRQELFRTGCLGD